MNRRGFWFAAGFVFWFLSICFGVVVSISIVVAIFNRIGSFLLGF